MCAGEDVFTATYEITNVNCTVKFVNYDGTEISLKKYRYGETIEEPTAPTKESDLMNSYTFSGWDKEVGICTGDVVFTAVYDATPIKYTVKFVNYDGTEISAKEYGYGATIEIPNEPTRNSDKVNDYTFSGWDKEVGTCDGDTVFTAVYEATPIKYTVKFVDNDGKEIWSGEYSYGETIKKPTDPEGKKKLKFEKWDKEVGTCTGDVVFTAVYKTKKGCKGSLSTESILIFIVAIGAVAVRLLQKRIKKER